MDQHEHHEELIKGIAEAYAEILNDSTQGIYIYLDDTHKVCNKKFSNLLEYSSAEEWAQTTESFPQTFVQEDSQEKLISAFQDAMESKTASTNSISWKTKNGSTVETTVILVPVIFNNHLFALHFISEK